MIVNMGQNNSSSPCFPKSKRRVPRFLTKKVLSHTFSLPNDNETYNHLNINLATEEQLMTLRGVDRDIAKGIVKHRQQIGRFRRIDDLALVAGIGAEKLDVLRGEVCVKSNSCTSSRAQSVDSLKSSDIRSPKLLDVNKASVFELQCLNGMNQEMAANIVQYRTKKGPFKKIDDLVKVRSINHPKLSNISHQLTISDDDSGMSRTTSASEALSNHFNGNGVMDDNTSPVKCSRKTQVPIKLQVANGLPSAASLIDVYDLLSAYSHRPKPEEEFKYERNGNDAFRLGTWNLHEFTIDKADNLGVREVICRTILENRLSLVALQDVLDEEAVKLICDELNVPKLRKVAQYTHNSYDWHYVTLPNGKLAFIYDKSSGGLCVELQEVDTSYDSWALARFGIGQRTFHVVNVQLTEDFDSNDLWEKIDHMNNNNHNNNNNRTDDNRRLIVMGDFGECCRRESCPGRFKAVIPINTNTGLCDVPCNDNIFVWERATLTGKSKRIENGLTHLAIPNGWTWGGPVSPHCPLWVELYVNAPSNGL